MATLPNYDRISLAVNGGFEDWTSGTGAFTGDLDQIADGWYADEGASSAFSTTRDNTHQDAFSAYCAAVAYTHAAVSSVQQGLPAAFLPILKSRGVSFAIRVSCATAGVLYPWISEDGGTTKQYGRPNGENGVISGYETLKAEGFALTTAATQLVVGVEFRGSCTAYLDNATVVLGSACADFQDCIPPEILRQLGDLGGGLAPNEATLFKSANFTMTEAENGYTMVSQLDGIVYTLPSTVVGYVYRFVNLASDGAASLAISPAAADRIMGVGLTSADNKDIVNTKATAKRGDMVELVGDGVNGWMIRRIVGTWAREA